MKSLKPFIITIEHLRREIAWSKSIGKHTHDEETTSLFEPIFYALGHSLLASIQEVSNVVHLSYNNHIGSLISRSLHKERATVASVRERLLKARDEARDHLRRLFGGLNGSPIDPPEDFVNRVNGLKLMQQERWDFCLFTISLLQVCFPR